MWPPYMDQVADRLSFKRWMKLKWFTFYHCMWQWLPDSWTIKSSLKSWKWRNSFSKSCIWRLNMFNQAERRLYLFCCALLPKSAHSRKGYLLLQKVMENFLFKGQKCLCFWEWRSHDSVKFRVIGAVMNGQTWLSSQDWPRGVPAEGGRGLWPWPSEQGTGPRQMTGILSVDSAIGWGSAWEAEPSLGDRGKSRVVSVIGVQEMLSQILEMGRGLHHAGEGNE